MMDKLYLVAWVQGGDDGMWGENWSSLYVRARDGEWHLSAKRIGQDWMGRHVAQHGFEVVG